VPRRINRGRERPDILALAGSLGLHAVYVPSMRNGSADPDGREDRGNAILSTEPLTDLTAIELPFARQRRVAIKATLTLAGRAVHLLDVHLDTRGGRVRQAQALAGYLSSLPRGHGDWLILGGDLNALRGPRDHAFRVLAATWPAVACGEGRTNRWPIALDVFARWWRGRTDFLFGAPAAALAGVTCETVDGYFGSDHRPIVLTIPATAN
jgi:endonuclease/exonuclease/phosphatase family metal-dependent hydrolase